MRMSASGLGINESRSLIQKQTTPYGLLYKNTSNYYLTQPVRQFIR